MTIKIFFHSTRSVYKNNEYCLSNPHFSHAAHSLLIIKKESYSDVCVCVCVKATLPGTCLMSAPVKRTLALGENTFRRNRYGTEERREEIEERRRASDEIYRIRERTKRRVRTGWQRYLARCNDVRRQVLRGSASKIYSEGNIDAGAITLSRT